MPNEPINSKVTASAVGGTVGGGTLAIVLIQILQKGFHVSPDWFTPEMVVVLTSLIGGLTAFASGWYKKHVPE